MTVVSQRAALAEYVRGALWVLPSASVVASLVAGTLLSQVEIREGSPLYGIVFQGGADAARELLIVVSATMITVTGLVFSLTVVALQIASSQFSPRLLRNFLRDRGNQVVLSVFVSTFAYSLAGLHTVRNATPENPEVVPRLAISGALFLALLSLAMLVYFIHHIAWSIQIDTIMRQVERETLEVIDDVYPDPLIGEEHAALLPEPPEGAVLVNAASSGYLQWVDSHDLLDVAREHDVSIRVLAHVGEHLVEGTPMAWVWRRGIGHPLDTDRLGDQIQHAVHVGWERTMRQDIRFGIRRLVDIAIRALSPAVNDPYTAVQAVHHLSVLCCTLAERRITSEVLTDEDGEERVWVPRRKFAAYLDQACGQIRRSGAREPRVGEALLRLLGHVGSRVGASGRREAVAAQIRLVLADAEREVTQERDFDDVRAAAAAALAVLDTALVRP